MRPSARTTGLPASEAAGLTRDEVRLAVAGCLGLAADDLNADDNLVVLGLSSLEVMQLVNRWKRQGIRADFRVLAARPTLSGWWEHLSP
ncbi:phosphopantetheine-binding protein [Nonomuraea sp. NN258]|nr:phosphopantetheine-binding protein [Nonomuraea antri]